MCLYFSALTVIYKVIAVLYERRKPKPAEDAEPLLVTAKHHVKPRLMSLDAFRGISLFFMVFVNCTFEVKLSQIENCHLLSTNMSHSYDENCAY